MFTLLRQNSRQVRNPRRYLATFLLTSTTFLLPGCIVGEMRDDLKSTRVGVESLSDLVPQLKESNAALLKANAQLVEANARLEISNAKLTESVRLLQTLDPMKASLRDVNESLASLRKMMENIDRAIPLINITAGTPPADTALERQRQAPVTDPASHAPSPQPPK